MVDSSYWSIYDRKNGLRDPLTATLANLCSNYYAIYGVTKLRKLKKHGSQFFQMGKKVPAPHYRL